MRTMILPDDKDMLAEIIVEKVQQIKTLENENDRLKNRIEQLEKRIKSSTDLENRLMDEIEIMTSEELEYHVKRIEMYSDVFSYGRVGIEEKKMAESL